MRKFLVAAMGAASLVAMASPASAALLTGVFSVTVNQGVSPPGGFSVAGGNPFTGPNTAQATFFYTGPINFFNNAAQSTGPTGDLNSAFGFSTSNISGYAGTGTVDFNSVNVANFSNVNRFLASSGSSAGYQYGSYYTFDLGTILAGTVITITHDDGAAFFQGATQIGNTVTGHSRQNGTPSILIVDAVAPVPEPATWAMMLLGFGAMGAMLRWRKTRTTARIRFA